VNSPTVTLTDRSGKLPINSTYQIRAFRYTSYGDPPVFHTFPDPYTAPDNFGPLIGNGEGLGAQLFLFLSIEGNDPNRIALFPAGKGQGTLELPSLTINGQRYEAQMLEFKFTHAFEFMSLNC
jgi:hypothetical protein